MVKCAVKYCQNTSSSRIKKIGKNIKHNDKISFHRFPKNLDACKIWMEICQTQNIELNNARVCSIHFDSNSYKTGWQTEYLSEENIRPILKPDAIPTKNLPNDLLFSNSLNSSINQSLEKINAVHEHVNSTKPMEEISINKVACNNQQNVEKSIIAEEYAVDPVDTINNSSDNINLTQPELFQTEKYTSSINFSRIADEISKIKIQADEYRIEIDILKQKLQKLETVNNKLLQSLAVSETKLEKKDKLLQKYIHGWTSVFTPTQIKILMNPGQTKSHWQAEDIASAISLRAVSPRGYRYLRTKMNFPLPSITTLKRWASKLDLNPGPLEHVFMIMKQKIKKTDELYKYTVLSFDELYISNIMEIDRKDEEVIGPHKTVQVIMARGLFNNWKQPIYYAYDTAVTKEILLDVITKLYDCGYRVVGTVCDFGTKNAQLLKSLNVGYVDDDGYEDEDDTRTCDNLKYQDECDDNKTDKSAELKKCYFEHPCNKNYHIYVFLDAPHMIKLARNHFIDHGFVYQNCHIKKNCLERILQLQKTSDLRIAFKLKDYHLNCTHADRQKVSYATKLFSNSNASAIQFFAEKGYSGFEDAADHAQVIKLFNDWFDIFNSKLKYNYQNPLGSGFGSHFNDQVKVIYNMKEFITEMRVYAPNKRGMALSMKQFQKGIAIDCDSLLNLFDHLKKTQSVNEPKILYIPTYRINQDILENTFSYLRRMGGNNDHPNALDIKHRFRWYILGKHSLDFFSIGANNDNKLMESEFSLIDLNDITTGDANLTGSDDENYIYNQDEVLTQNFLDDGLAVDDGDKLEHTNLSDQSSSSTMPDEVKLLSICHEDLIDSCWKEETQNTGLG